MQMNWKTERGRDRERGRENEIEMNILCNSFALHFKYSCSPETTFICVSTYRYRYKCACVCVCVLLLYSLYCFYCPPCCSIVMGLNSLETRAHTHTYKIDALCAYLRTHLKKPACLWKSLHFILLSHENKNFLHLCFFLHISSWARGMIFKYFITICAKSK